MKKAIPVIAILGLFMAAPLARAAAPQLVPVQGVLTDSTDAPVDGTVTAVFSIYTSEVGGTALWTETQSVLVEEGLFTAYMGDVTTLDLTLFRDNGDLWLGIQIDSDAEMDRVLLGSNPFAGYAEYCGSAPAPDFADITGTVDPADLPAGLVTGPLACTGTEKVSGVDSSGALVCAVDVDTDTTYTAGTGLTLTGTTFSADTTGLQARVTGTCAADNSIRVINADGTVVCEPDTNTNAATICAPGTFLNGDGTCDVIVSSTGDIEGVIAGSGLTGGGTSGTVTVSVGTGAITATHLAANSVGTSEVINESLTSDDLGAGSVGSSEIFGSSMYGRLHHGNTAQCGSANGWAPGGGSGTLGTFLENCNSEGAGIYMDGNRIAIWAADSPLLGIYDEDMLSGATTTALPLWEFTNTSLTGQNSSGTDFFRVNTTGITQSTSTGTRYFDVTSDYMRHTGDLRVNLPYASISMGTGTTGSSAIYVYPSGATFTPEYNGVCLVSTLGTIYRGTVTAGGPYYRTARRVGTTDNNDGQFGTYFPPGPGAGAYEGIARANVWTVSAGTSHSFGCYFSGTSTSGWTGRTAYCHVSRICFYQP